MATNDPYPSAEREARRALLADSLAELASASDPETAATDVVRALDHYIDAGGPPAVAASPELRARLRESLGDVARGAPGSGERMTGAIDEYLESVSASPAQREPSVTNFGRLGGNEVKWARWGVVILAVMTTTVIAVTFSGGFLVGGIILAVWVAVLIAVGLQ